MNIAYKTPQVFDNTPKLLKFDNGTRDSQLINYPFLNLRSLSKKVNVGNEHHLTISVDETKTINLHQAQLVFNLKIGKKNSSGVAQDFVAADVVAFKQNPYAFYDQIEVYAGDKKNVLFKNNYNYITKDVIAKTKGTPEYEWSRDGFMPDYISEEGTGDFWAEKKKKRLGLTQKRVLLAEKFGTTSWTVGAEMTLPFPVDIMSEMNKQVNYGNLNLYLRVGDAANCIYYPARETTYDYGVSMKIESIYLRVPVVTPDPRESQWLLDGKRQLEFTGLDDVQLVELHTNQKTQKLDPIVLQSVPKHLTFVLLNNSELRNPEISEPRFYSASDKIETISHIEASDTDEFKVYIPHGSRLSDTTDYPIASTYYTIKNVRYPSNVFGRYGFEMSPNPNLVKHKCIAKTTDETADNGIDYDTLTFSLAGCDDAVLAGGWGTDVISSFVDDGEWTIEIDDSQKNFLDYVEVDVKQDVIDETGNKVNTEHLFTSTINKRSKRFNLSRGEWENIYYKFKKLGGFGFGRIDSGCAYTIDQFKECPIWTVPLSASNKVPLREFKSRTSDSKQIDIQLDFLNNIHTDDDIRVLLMFSYKGVLHLESHGNMQSGTAQLL